MTNKKPKKAENSNIEELSVEDTRQLLRQQSLRQAELEVENQQLKRQLQALHQKQAQAAAAAGTSSDSLPQSPFEKNLPVNNGLLRCIIDSVSDLIYIKDLDSVYRGCNEASERFVGLMEVEQIGKTDFDFFDAEMAEAILEVDRQILTSGQEHRIEEWIPSPSGDMRLLETRKAPFYGPDGKVAGIVGISRDITVSKQAEEALKEANRELDAFVYTVSHDLRTPLTAILGYSDLLIENSCLRLDAAAQDYLSEVIQSAETMLALLEDLLALSTVRALDQPAVALDAGEVARAVVSELAEALAQGGVTVEIGDLPTLRVPRTLLVQVFDNLIGNALKYGCHPHAVIKVGGERNGERVKLFVRDHGVGIPLAERERIFEVFYRGSAGKEKKGTGIGLATIQKIAKLFGGRAWVEETPGGGSTFCLVMIDGPA